MKVVFYMSDKWREALISMAFCKGVQMAGDEAGRMLTQEYVEPEIDTDVAVVFGVKGYSKRIMDDHLTLGRHVVYIDKGYIAIKSEQSNRRSRALYYKVSLDAFQPLKLLSDKPPDRWRTLRDEYGIELKPWRTRGEHVLWLGPSQKYCDFHGIGNASEFSKKAINCLKKNSHRPVMYRPKHSWNDATPIAGSIFSKAKNIVDDLRDCYAVATHGSNSSVPAIINGVPVLALGPAITRPIAETNIGDIHRIRCPSDEEREAWLRNICYWQWTMAEMDQGIAWKHLREML